MITYTPNTTRIIDIQMTQSVSSKEKAKGEPISWREFLKHVITSKSVADVSLTAIAEAIADFMDNTSWGGARNALVGAIKSPAELEADSDKKDFGSIIGSAITRGDQLNVKDAIYLFRESDTSVNIKNSYEGFDFSKLSGGNKFGAGAAVLGKISTGLSTATDAANVVSSFLLGPQAGGTTYNTWINNAQGWKEVQNLSLNFTFTFKLGEYGLWNAKQEVVLPILNLLAPVIPRYIGDFTQTGPAVSFWGLMGAIIGDFASDFLSAVTGKKNETINDLTNTFSLSERWSDTIRHWGAGAQSVINYFIDNIINGLSSNSSFIVTVGGESPSDGFVTYKGLIYKDANVSFSNKTDQYGYPISGNITMNFDTIMPPGFINKHQNLQSIRFGLNN